MKKYLQRFRILDSSSNVTLIFQRLVSKSKYLCYSTEPWYLIALTTKINKINQVKCKWRKSKPLCFLLLFPLCTLLFIANLQHINVNSKIYFISPNNIDPIESIFYTWIQKKNVHEQRFPSPYKVSVSSTSLLLVHS